MLAFKQLVAPMVLAAAMPVMAAPIFLDFESSPLEPTRAGNSYEAKFGVVFTGANALTIHSNLSSPKPNSGGNFTRYGDESKAALGLFYASGAPGDFYINVAAGFSGKFSMLYTTTLNASGFDFVELFSGESGTGGLIQAGSRPDPNKPGSTLPGAALAKQAPCVDPKGIEQKGIYCTWAELALDFTDTAKSVHISGASGVYFFDNMTFGPLDSTQPGTDVPEPAGIALSLAALGALAWTRKRYQR